MGIFSAAISARLKTNAQGNLTVTYERIWSFTNRIQTKITARPRVADKYIFSLGGDFNASFEPGSIWPRPDRMYSQNDRLFLVYNHLKVASNFSVGVLRYADQPGKVEPPLQLNGEPEIRFWQFIYP